MNFYEIGINDRGLKTHQTLTYSSEDRLNVGDVVEVKIRNRSKNGIVISDTKKPDYKTRSIERILLKQAISKEMIRFARQLSSYYAVDLGTAIGLLLPRGIEKKRRETKPKKLKKNATQAQPKLTEAQVDAIKQIRSAKQTHILKGVTGSGKTRVYIELAKAEREKGQTSIILVPEIGLTSQMVAEFESAFDDELYVVHSNQTETQRHRLWEAIRAANCPVVIGPRSALFSPIKKLGLVVVDEEHETSYKQDVSPKYHAVRAAGMLRQIYNATLVLGSATPSVEDYYFASKNTASVIEMKSPVKKLEATDISIVDMKNRDEFSRNKWLSDQLLKKIETCLAQDKQVLVFQNRRGNATSIICENCGWVDECPNCLIPLTHHSDWAKNVCHTCNYRHDVMSACPDCGKPELVYRGAGTKELYTNLRKIFPLANIERFDSDVSDKEKKLEQRHKAIVDGDVDIIVGTQMIAKGLDIPKLGLVGIANADTALHLPDYSSSERTFQLIAQVVGRVGRHQKGQVVIQTYSPSNPSILLATKQDWDAFYEKELADRKIAGYPPFQFLLQMTIEEKTNDSAAQSAKKLAEAIKTQVSNVAVLGPSPAFHHKTRTGWRWQVVVKSPQRDKLVNIATNLPPKWQHELDPNNLL